MRNPLIALLLATAGGACAQNIVGYEFWFNEADQQRQYVAVPPAGAVVLGNESIPLGTLPHGHHQVHYRLKDSNARWGGVISKPMSRLVGGPHEITGGEYWFDESTTRTSFNIGPGQTVSATIDPVVSGLAQGSHKAHYRLRDNHGFWSSVASRPFMIQPGSPHQLVLLRYWSDPAAQNPSDMTERAIAPPVQYLDIIDDVLFCNWSITGQPTPVHFQLKDNHGQWSSVISQSINVDLVTAPPDSPGPISGMIAPPLGSTQTYSIGAVAGAGAYNWFLPAGWTGSSSGTSITVQVGGTNDAWQLCVSAYNGCGESDTTCLSIVTGLDQGARAGGIALYPNPTRGTFFLHLPQRIEARELAVMDAVGRTVQAQAIANASSPIAIDLGGHESGLYFVQVLLADGTQAVQRVVKE